MKKLIIIISILTSCKSEPKQSRNTYQGEIDQAGVEFVEKEMDKKNNYDKL